MSAPAVDAIVVGGGIVGASAAFFLRRRGLSVTLLERRLVGQEASGTNFGNIRRQGRPLSQLPVAHRAYDIWRRLPELLGESCEFLPVGHLRVAYDEAREANFRQYAKDAAETGLVLEVLAGRALHERFPYLGPEVRVGSYSPADGHANPRLAAPAFGRAARTAGVSVIENATVTAIEKDGDDFRVATAAGEHRAPLVLVSAGAWAGALCEALGEPVPLEANGPQMGVTEPVRYRLAPTLGVSTDVKAESIYLRQVERGNVVFGGGPWGPADPVAGRSYVLPENTAAQLAQLRRFVPALARVNVIRAWSGIESYLPDELPVMGPSTRWPGLYYAFGFSGAGFQTGPGVGDAMAELMATGSCASPLEAFTMARFQRAA